MPPEPEWITRIPPKARWCAAHNQVTKRHSARSLNAISSKCSACIHGIVRQRNDVEDIAQQVFAKVYLSVRNFDFRSSLITWIYKITVNECFDYLRKKKVRKLVYESDMSEVLAVQAGWRTA